MQRDRVFSVDQAMIRIEKSNLARRTLQGDLYRVFAKQCVDRLDIVLHISQAHCTQTHCASSGEPGTHAEVDPSWRKTVE